MDKKKNRRAPLLPNLLLSGGVVVVMLIIIEIVFRLAGIANPSFYIRNDESLGHALRPYA